METVIIAKCVSCGYKREIKAGEIPNGEVPMCPKCFSLMMAEKAQVKLCICCEEITEENAHLHRNCGK